MQCSAKTKSNQQCKAKAVKGFSTCFRHTPEMKDSALSASIKGGLANRNYQQYFQINTIKTPADIQTLLENTIQSILSGNMPASNPGNTIGFLARGWLDAFDRVNLQQRIEKIENTLFPNTHLD